jgi:heterotetrameric sarcosine oxidase gamma subunit
MSDAATIPDAARKLEWAPRGAWAELPADGHLGTPGAAGTTITARNGLGIASLIAAEGSDDALVQAVKTRFGLDLPATPLAVRSATHALVWAGPGQWLLVAEDRSGFADDLQALSGLAAIAEQSDGRGALTLSGPKIRDALAKGCMIDLHPSVFPIGAVALTSTAHIGVHLWRVADGPDGAVFEIMVARSMAGSFWSWLSASVAEFGCTLAATGRG